MNYNIWNKWDKLQTVMLGDCYGSKFFRDIKDIKVRSALQRIADETQEDLECFYRILKDFGCTIIRPKLDTNDSIMNYTDNNGKLKSIPRGPLQPRDAQVVIGNSLFYVCGDHPSITNTLDEYDKNYKNIKTPIPKKNYLDYIGNGAPDWPSYDDLVTRFFKNKPLSDDININKELLEMSANEQRQKRFTFPVAAPSITVVGKDIYVDIPTDVPEILRNYCFAKFTTEYADFRINYLTHGGHSDGCFHTIKPGAILSLQEIQTYEDTFPGWDVCYLPDQSWDKVKPFTDLKNEGKWWVPGEEDNPEFTHFVETWLQDWVGYVEETVFDVNVLVLDEHHVCVSQQDNEIVNAFLKKHNMEPVYVPWRHRYFWDGGLHCITLDLKRQGTQQDYFPKRQTAIIDKGFDYV